MSRTTHLVGLTTSASAFTETLEATGQYVGAHGIAGEDIEMSQWRDADDNEYWEVTQTIPWSSGPCIFTCLDMRWAKSPTPTPTSAETLKSLRIRLKKVSDGGVDIDAPAACEILALLDVYFETTRLFEWTLDPSLKEAEWDHDRGVYWI